MPSEVLNDDPRCDTSLDVFSCGGMKLDTVNGKQLKATALTNCDPKTHQLQVKGFSKVECSQDYLVKMTGEVEVLRPLVETCRYNNSVKCPSILVLLKKIKGVLYSYCMNTVTKVTIKIVILLKPVTLIEQSGNYHRLVLS